MGSLHFLSRFLSHLVEMKAGDANTVTLEAATNDFTEDDELEIIKYVLSREAGTLSASFQEGIWKRYCFITYETSNKRKLIQQFHLNKHSVNCATTLNLIPFVDKYLAAVEKRDRSPEATTPVEAPDRKASRPEGAVPRDPTPAEERIAIATELFGESVDDAELEVMQKLLTKEIDKRKKPSLSVFDERKIGSLEMAGLYIFGSTIARPCRMRERS